MPRFFSCRRPHSYVQFLKILKILSLFGTDIIKTCLWKAFSLYTLSRDFDVGIDWGEAIGLCRVMMNFYITKVDCVQSCVRYVNLKSCLDRRPMYCNPKPFREHRLFCEYWLIYSSYVLISRQLLVLIRNLKMRCRHFLATYTVVREAFTTKKIWYGLLCLLNSIIDSVNLYLYNHLIHDGFMVR